ncbi:MAG: pilus assembly PilX family protein [Thermodesulfobacteriota bacterium]
MIRRSDEILRNQRGATLVVALMIMLVLTLICLAGMMTSTFDVMLSGNKRAATDAFFSADGGGNVITARVENFNLSKYDPNTNKFDPFTDNDNPNPMKAKGMIEYQNSRAGSSRGIGYSASSLRYAHFMVTSTGKDQIAFNDSKSTCTIQQKVVRIIPLE